MKSDRAPDTSRTAAAPDREDLAFLPAALEIVETPPSPIGRAIVYAIIALFCAALAWACLGRIDIVASAPGKVIPTGRIKVVQPLEAGVISAILVRDGDAVKAGDVLIELDPTVSDAERARQFGDLVAALLDITRLNASLSTAPNPIDEFHPPTGAMPELVATQRQLLIDRIAEHRAKLGMLDRQRAQKEAERDTVTATIAKLEATIGVVKQRLDLRRTLFERELGSRLQYLELLQLMVEQEQDLLVQKSRYNEAEQALGGIIESRTQTEAEYRRTLLAELSESKRKAASLAQDVIKAEQKAKQQILTAPIDGTVQQLSVHTVGGVVTPAQALLVIVPRESKLEVEAMISNRDIGFVRAGQQTEIKVDTFPFTRYGLLHGEVLSVSPDAITRDRAQDKSTPSAPAGEPNVGDAKGQELAYAARVSLDRTQMQVENNMVNLSPGMAVTVEIKTGARRVISYLLSPLLKYQQESLRER